MADSAATEISTARPVELPQEMIALVLAYACDAEALGGRRYFANKSWLEAHHAPGLWTSLILEVRPNRPCRDKRHGVVSAWSRAPAALRGVVARHTRRVTIYGWSNNGNYEGTYSLGTGLAGTQFAVLEMVNLRVYNFISLQSIEEDAAALAPLFVTRGVKFVCIDSSRGYIPHIPSAYRAAFAPSGDVQFIRPDWCGSLLDSRNMHLLARRFRRLQKLALPAHDLTILGGRATVALPPTGETRFLLSSESSGDGDEFSKYALLDLAQAQQLVAIDGSKFSSLAPAPASLFPNLKFLYTTDSKIELTTLGSFFASCAVACPALEVLIFRTDCEYETWWKAENYAAFARVPRTLLALGLVLDMIKLPAPATASSFVRLVQDNLAQDCDCGVHVVTPRYSTDRIPGYTSRQPVNLTNDRVLPKPPWSGLYPPIEGQYSPEVLRRSTYQHWPDPNPYVKFD